jgi:hypothetical protein
MNQVLVEKLKELGKTGDRKSASQDFVCIS